MWLRVSICIYFLKINILQSIYDAQCMLSRHKKTLVNRTNKILPWSGKNEKPVNNIPPNNSSLFSWLKLPRSKQPSTLEDRTVTGAQRSVRSLE